MSAPKRKTKEHVLHWERFEPIAYELNWSVLTNLKVTVTNNAGSSTRTIGEVLRDLMPRRFAPLPENVLDALQLFESDGGMEADDEVEADEESEAIPTVGESVLGSYRIRTPGREICVEGLGDDHFPAQILRHVLELLRLQHGTGYGAQLFFYGSDDWHRESSWGERFYFFVAVGDRIVLDDLTLSSLCLEDIDESVVKPAWYIEGDSWKKPGQDTGLRLWYRQFYTETKAGQAMVLRTDSPRIFHYEPPEHREAAKARNLARIAQAATCVGVAAVIWALQQLFRH